ncbi:MAG: SCO family protein [Myxococcota bacterium]
MSDAPARQDDMAYRGGPIQRSLRKHPWLWGTVFGILAITLSRPLFRQVPDPPPVLGEVPEFELVDQDGDAFGLDGLEGDVWVASFIFTTCTTTCPMVTGAMADLAERVERAGVPVEQVSVTVDPETDRPEVLREYAQKYDVDFDRWHFLTGSEEDIRALVVDGFGTAMGEKKPIDANVYDIAHTTRLVLVDDLGRIRGYYSSTDDGVDEMFHRAQHVLREAGEEGRL